MPIAALALALSLAATDPAPAAGSPPAPPPADQTAPPKPDPKTDPKKIICEETPSIGSVIPHRICRTRAEWDRRAHDDQHRIRDFQDQVN